MYRTLLDKYGAHGISTRRFHNSPGCEDALALYRKKVGIDDQISRLRKDIKDSKGMAFRAELKGMKRVLRRYFSS